MSFFDNGEKEEFLLFVRNFNMTLAASGTLETVANIQNLRTLVFSEALCQFDSFSAEVKSTDTLDVEYIIKGLAFYFTPVNLLKKKTMRCRMKKPRGLKVRRYAARLIDPN